MDQEYVADDSRSPTEVAYRALALMSVIAVALGAERAEILDWLKQHDLWQSSLRQKQSFSIHPILRSSRLSTRVGFAKD